MFKKIILATALSLASFAAISAPTKPNTAHETISVSNSYELEKSVDGKPLVIDFFWYGCGHCYKTKEIFSPMIQEELKNDKVVYKRYPVVFPGWESGARMFFTIQALGKEDELHDKIFYTVQEERKNILDDANLRKEFLEKEGVDVTEFETAYNSFGVNNQMQQAKEVIKSYKISSTPTFVLDNTYVFGPGINKGYGPTVQAIKEYIDLNTGK